MSPPRSPWNRLLLATEHGEFDVGAERLALDLARRGAGTLVVVLPVAANPEVLAQVPDHAARLDAEAAGRRDALLAAARAAGVAATVNVRAGDDLAAVVVTEATRTDAQLVVIRRRGHRGFLARLLVGEMAGRVAARAPCDVLMAPRAAEPWRRAVLGALDASPGGHAVAEAAARVAAAHGLPLHLVSVTDRPGTDPAGASPTALARGVAAAARIGAAATAAVRVGAPDAQIVAAANELGADLIVIGRHGGTDPLHPRHLGATALKVIGRATCPVLVVRR